MSRAPGAKPNHGLSAINPPQPADICIISENAMELTTELVIDWLASMGVSALRLNGESLAEDRLSLGISKDSLSIAWPEQIGGIPADQIRTVWYRRWNNTKRYRAAIVGDGTTWESKMQVELGVRGELRTLRRFLLHFFERAQWLGNPKFSEAVDKLTMLKLAREHGLDVPATLVSSDGGELRSFAAKYSQVITKTMTEGIFLFRANASAEWGFDIVTTYTTIPPKDIIENLKANTFPSMLQECLHKEYEIRSFYLDGEIYSTAIFSQAVSQMTTDYHRYQYRTPARMVPYRLPDSVKERLCSLMRAANLDTGSIDLVRTTDGRLVFLEVNPNGQFSAYSLASNYFLEKRVAEVLLRKRNYA